MTGVIVNTIAVIIGSTLGIIVKNGLNERLKTTISQAVGLVALYIGLSTSVGRLILPEAHPVLFILSLVIGGILGEWINIEGKLGKFAEFMDSRLGKGEKSVSKGFMAASLIFCVGTMAVIGAVESGISGNNSILYAKSVMDGITAVVLASTYGIGVMFSAAAVFFYEGAIAVTAQVAGPYMTDDMIRELSIVGGILISCIGLDMLGIKKINVENLIPSLIIPVFYYLIAGNFNF